MNKSGISRLVTASAVLGITAVGLSNAAYAVCANANSIPLFATATCTRVNGTIAPGGIPCIGTAGPDLIVGSVNDDVIESLQGNDIVVGLEGNDTICTSTGNDIVDTGFSFGVETARTGDGNDVVSSSGFGSVHNLGTGNDVSTTAFAVINNGGSGNDALFGDIFDDVLNGGPGNDLLSGADGTDTLNGAGGSDVCIAGSPGVGFETLISCEFGF